MVFNFISYFDNIFFWLRSNFFTYYTILLPSKLKEGYSSLNEIISEDYLFKKEYFIEKFYIFEKRIYLNKIEKVILGYYEDGDDDDGDLFFYLLIEYEGKKIFIPSGSVEKFLKYFSENLSGFDSSILKNETIDDSKIKMLPISLYEKSKLL
ncbi:MAG: hypothetical protein KBA66_15450 [Leptospiraceae bacterium]|nr:hypothetical protein [Leptospiraceae bacterium]